MNRKRSHFLKRFRAFSVLEVTIVIALMALLGALFFGAMNRFNEQIANETRIKNELNEWFLVRANLWRELDDADSIHVEKDQADIYLEGKMVRYKIMDNRLYREHETSEATDMHIVMNGIGSEDSKGRKYVVFRMDWKNDEMVLRYPLRSTVAGRINHFFSAKQWH